jgi:hypothetical protein
MDPANSMSTLAIERSLNEVKSPLQKELIDVTRRILEQAKHNEHKWFLGQRDPTKALRAVKTLRIYAIKLHRLYEIACNRELSWYQSLLERKTEAKALSLAHLLGVSLTFNADPRGAPLQIKCDKQFANSFCGECILIPWLPSKEYK